MQFDNIMPLVTIILPTYNRASIIRETINSIQRQTYNSWELIIVDDGSDDNTGEIIKDLNDNRIQFHKAGRIGIGGRIKNIGISFAKGEMIAFIDSDDLWAPEKLEKQVTALQQNPEAGFCMTGGYNFREPGLALDYFYKQREGRMTGNIFLSLFRSEIAGYAQVLLFRKVCLANTGLFREEKSFSDIDFIASLARHYTAVVIFEPLLYRRLHPGNYIHDNWEKSFFEGIDFISGYYKQGLLPASVARQALFKAHINFGEKYLLRSERGRAIREFLKAWYYRPFSIIPARKTGKVIISKFKNRLSIGVI